MNLKDKTLRVMHRAGLLMVYSGALMLIASYVLGCTDINALLFICLFLIVAGIVLHVAMLKRESRY